MIGVLVAKNRPCNKVWAQVDARVDLSVSGEVQSMFPYASATYPFSVLLEIAQRIATQKSGKNSPKLDKIMKFPLDMG